MRALRGETVRSCLYEGSVRHRRRGEVQHEFSYPLFMAYLDLDELPAALSASRLFSARGPAPAWFRRADHLGDPRAGLAQSVRELVRERTGTAPAGPIGLLTNLRYFGHCFNPVSFYYCFEETGEHVQAAIAHVTNTPWGERHSYVLPVSGAADRGSAEVLSGSFAKELHVSPLMSMEHVYDWRLTVPADHLAVHIESHTRSGESVFDATLALDRRELEGPQMRRALARYPLLSMRIVARIYGHALRLRLKGATYFPHPARGAPAR
jgi:DUF1365 family protein